MQRVSSLLGKGLMRTTWVNGLNARGKYGFDGWKRCFSNVNSFGADVTIPNDAARFEFWAEISGTDSKGVSIEGIKKDDIIEIETLNGICSFDKTNLSVLAGFVAIMNGVLQDGASYYTEGEAANTMAAISDQAKKLEDALNKDIKHKRRDGFGQDPGTNDYAKNEGGIIVCMPDSHGAIYATSENHLQDGAKGNGRQQQYYSDNIKKLKSWFPCNKNMSDATKGGIMKKTAETNGTVNVLAFDQKFTDNGGTYEVKLTVTRESDKLNAHASKMALETIKNSQLRHMATRMK